MGGPPACSNVLLMPETHPHTYAAPGSLPISGMMLCQKANKIQNNANIICKLTADKVCMSVPAKAIPHNAARLMAFISFKLTDFLYRPTVRASIINNSGNISATACCTGITNDKSGTATTPAPPANPDFDMPVRITPTMAKSQNT